MRVAHCTAGALALAVTASVVGPPALQAADEPVIDRGSTVRPTTVLDFPDRSGKPLGQLPPAAPVDIYERQRLWLRIKPAAGAPGPAGWVTLMDLRMGYAVAPAVAASAPGQPPPAPPAAAGNGGMFSSLSRSVSGLLAGFQTRRTGYASGSNATIGIRGLTGAELNASTPNFQALTDVQRYAVAPAQAQMFANAGGLVPQRIMYVVAPPPAGAVVPAPGVAPFDRPTPFGGRR